MPTNTKSKKKIKEPERKLRILYLCRVPYSSPLPSWSFYSTFIHCFYMDRSYPLEKPTHFYTLMDNVYSQALKSISVDKRKYAMSQNMTTKLLPQK